MNRERQRETETERETIRQTDRQTNKMRRERDRERETERDRGRERQRQTDRHFCQQTLLYNCSCWPVTYVGDQWKNLTQTPGAMCEKSFTRVILGNHKA